jgi:hypothetical protein
MIFPGVIQCHRIHTSGPLSFMSWQRTLTAPLRQDTEKTIT